MFLFVFLHEQNDFGIVHLFGFIFRELFVTMNQHKVPKSPRWGGRHLFQRGLLMDFRGARWGLLAPLLGSFGSPLLRFLHLHYNYMGQQGN